MLSVGMKIAALTLIRQTGQIRHGRNLVNVWLCQCSCGRTLDVDQESLVKGMIPACKTCRRGPCVICGKEIDNDEWSVKRNTCSDECYRENRRVRGRLSLANRVARDPEFHKKHYQAALTRDSEHNKKRYQRKLERLAKLPEHERLNILRKMAQQSNDWAKRRRQWLKENDPLGYEQFLLIRRAYYRKWYGQE
jgi:predicted nucleic acid-binding Zn ribbon protein